MIVVVTLVVTPSYTTISTASNSLYLRLNLAMRSFTSPEGLELGAACDAFLMSLEGEGSPPPNSRTFPFFFFLPLPPPPAAAAAAGFRREFHAFHRALQHGAARLHRQQTPFVSHHRPGRAFVRAADDPNLIPRRRHVVGVVEIVPEGRAAAARNSSPGLSAPSPSTRRSSPRHVSRPACAPGRL